jgi:xanthine/CO dehydrogenase XdhC/CoxF family maturation factor
MDRREVELLLRGIHEARGRVEPVAIATIVRVRGSAYRREGTRMLVRQDGSNACALSGGCLEPAVTDAALRVIASGTPAIVNYDLAEDSVWGLSMGCSGAIDVHIERLEDDDAIREWLRVLERDEPGVLVTPLAGASGRLLVRAGGEPIGTLNDPAIHDLAIDHARACLNQAVPHSSSAPIGASTLFFEVTTPAPDLVIFGAGPDAAPLAARAWTLGFDLTVVDPRPAHLTRERFPSATLVLAHAAELRSAVSLPRGAFVVVMNHHTERDEESLRAALESDVAYVGVLGPLARYRKLLAGLASRGYEPPASRLSCVRSPVGLSIGAETPEEVAVSILAEILAVRRGFGGGPLDGSVESLHQTSDTSLLARS